MSAILVTGASGQVGGEPRSFAEFVRDHANHFAAGLSSHM